MCLRCQRADAHDDAPRCPAFRGASLTVFHDEPPLREVRVDGDLVLPTICPLIVPARSHGGRGKVRPEPEIHDDIAEVFGAAVMRLAWRSFRATLVRPDVGPCYVMVPSDWSLSKVLWEIMREAPAMAARAVQNRRRFGVSADADVDVIKSSMLTFAGKVAAEGVSLTLVEHGTGLALRLDRDLAPLELACGSQNGRRTPAELYTRRVPLAAGADVLVESNTMGWTIQPPALRRECERDWGEVALAFQRAGLVSIAGAAAVVAGRIEERDEIRRERRVHAEPADLVGDPETYFRERFRLVGGQADSGYLDRLAVDVLGDWRTSDGRPTAADLQTGLRRRIHMMLERRLSRIRSAHPQ